MRSVFIRNQKGTITLQTRLKTLIKDADQLKFLVGFFYFSGLRELYEGLKNNSSVVLKILVGMNADILNQKLVEYPREAPQDSDKQHLQKYFDELKKSLGDEDFDNEAFYEQIIFFLKMIDEGRLLIRKTREPNHSKIYFVYDEDNPMKQKLFITGSSNLTRPGLTTQAEFNVEISDFGAEETEAYFDDLWEDAIPITEIEEFKAQLKVTIEQGTMIRDITPFEAFALTLKTYLDTFKQEEIGQSLIDTLKSNNYIPYQYQLDAVRQALSIIKDNNGVIIADVVGLGKSVIASAVAKALGKRGIVLCPPGLIGDENNTSGWNMYLDHFGLHDWKPARSVGDLEEAEEFVRKTNDIEVIIVDEAHRFRNQDTQDYDHLKNICRGKKVILLTATPFNNRPYDILALLNLFVASKQSTITLDPNIGAAFRSYNYAFERLAHISRYHNSPDDVKRAKAEDNYEKMFGELPIDLNKVKQRQSLLAKEIRDVISPVTIRRNRIDLIENPDYAEEVKDLSKVADPKEWFFELSPEQSKFYDKIIEHYFAPYKDGGRFTGVIYQPFMYETGEDPEKLGESDNFEFISQAQLSDFMRRLLVKRFESSFGSFDQSIRRFKGVYQTVKEFVKRTGKYILDRKLIEKIYEEDDEVIDQALIGYQNNLEMDNFPKRDKVYIIEDFKYKKEFLQNIDADIQMFDELIGILDDMNLVSDDPKSAELIKKINEELRKPPKPGEPKRKIIIFSEFADTVNHLRLALQPQFAKRLLVVSGNLSSSMIHTINQNFDASSTDQKDEYDILLSTDRISEGFNLNRAGMVINYDIPWNPVRVIQRVGRINRISRKVFDELYIVNFFPTEKGATIVKSREIAADKMFLIHNTLGEDVKIFNIDEEPTASALYTRIQQFPEEQEGASFYTQMLKRWNNIIQEHPELREDLKDFPPKVKVSKAADANELLVFFRKNRLFIQRLISGEKEAQLISFEEALPLVECPFDQKRLAFSTEFWKNYEIAKEIKIEQNNRGLTQQSVEVKALNNLKSLLRKELPEFSQHRDFLNTLLTDMQEWATLPKYTLRTIAGLKYGSKKDMDASVSAIQELYLKLGPDYLEKEIERFKQVQREIIIAVENQKL